MKKTVQKCMNNERKCINNNKNESFNLERPVNFSAAENYAEELVQSVIFKKYKKIPTP